METATTTDKQQLKHRGLNTQANKLNKITRGRGNSETPGETNKQEKLQRTTKHGTEQEISPHKTRGTQDRNHDTYQTALPNLAHLLPFIFLRSHLIRYPDGC